VFAQRDEGSVTGKKKKISIKKVQGKKRRGGGGFEKGKETGAIRPIAAKIFNARSPLEGGWGG